MTGCFADQGPQGETAQTSEDPGSSTSTSSGDETATTRGGGETSESEGETTEASTGTELETTGSTGDETTGDGGSSGTTCVEVLCFPDADGDGVGVSTSMPELFCNTCPEGLAEEVGDCDDDDDALSPALSEICDGQDNDCDELIDEYSPENASCDSCETFSGEYGELWFCGGGGDLLTWHEAREACMALGPSVDLAVLTELAEHAAIGEVINTPPTLYWVGLADEVVEGSFGWVDGSLLDYWPWADGEPNNIGDEDCAGLDPNNDSLLSDFDCDTHLGYICKAPAR